VHALGPPGCDHREVRMRQARPWLADGALTAALIAVTAYIGGQVRLPGTVPYDGVAFLLTLACYVPLALRRAAPVTVLR